MIDKHHLLVGTEQGLYRLSVDAQAPLVGLTPIAFEKLEVDPVARSAGEPATLYALVGQQELWRSADQGVRWTKIWESPKDTRLYTFLAHPTKPGVLYAGLEPAAVWMSDDGGQSWRELHALQAVPDKSEWRFFPPRQAHVRALAIRPGKPEMICVGIEEGGVYVSEDGGSTFHSRNEGLYRDIHTIRPWPEDPTLLFATTGDGLYRSTDQGRRWSHTTQGITRSYTVPLLIQSAPPHTMLVAGAKAPPPSWERGARGADAVIFRSRDGGLTWEEAASGFPSPQKGMVFCLLAHPRDPSQLFAGTTDGKVYASTDQGDQWGLLADGLPEVYSIVLTS